MSIPVRILFCAVVVSIAVSASAQSLFAVPAGRGEGFVIERVGDRATCRAASQAEAAQFGQPYAGPLVVFGEEGGRAAAGLNIILRATPQLDANPQAKQAFERAAAIWESRIADPLTIYMDVDFGLTRFGEPYASASTIGSTDNTTLYTITMAALRPALIAHANNAAEAAIYSLLPSVSIPTDIGASSQVQAPPMLVRVLGGLPAAANPDDGRPRIGFNSAFPFDLDPADGIDSDKMDFEGVAVHEMGHALGFTSRSGVLELFPAEPNLLSILDLFRFRPGVTTGSFTTAPRVQSSGGEHRYFDGSSTLALSTGRSDASGGDGNQASHWKADEITGVRIGLMDPTLDFGERGTLEQADVTAIGLLGYNVTLGSPPAAPTNLTATALSTTSIRLDWDDNANNEDQFRVESWNGSAFIDFGGFAANTETYTFQGLQPALTYTFRIRARNSAGDSAYSNTATATTNGNIGPCTANATTVCLLSNRFRVSIHYKNQFSNPSGFEGDFKTARLDSASGINPDVALFGFDNAKAVEVVVRIVDARPFAPRFDVYYGGLTDVEYTVTVTDTATGKTKTYHNAPFDVGGGVDRATFPAN